MSEVVKKTRSQSLVKVGAARVPLEYRAEVSSCEKPACWIASGTRCVYGKNARELEAEKATQRRSPTYSTAK